MVLDNDHYFPRSPQQDMSKATRRCGYGLEAVRHNKGLSCDKKILKHACTIY